MGLFYFIGTVMIGIFAGFLSGLFGIGGAAVTTPLMRIFLNVPGHVALGTPLPLVIPSAVFALAVYWKEKVVKLKTGLVCGVSGSVAAFAGAGLTMFFSGSQIMLITSFAIVLFAVIMHYDTGNNCIAEGQSFRRKAVFSVFIGVVAGFVSGFLGIGGGFLLVPLFLILRKTSMHEAVATSLLAISIYAIPGSITHFLLGNIDLGLIPLIFVGSVAGAHFGAKKSIKTQEKKLKLLLTGFLVMLALCLAAYELFRIYGYA